MKHNIHELRGCNCNCVVCSVQNGGMTGLEACLSGEALETIESLGYSEAAYEAVKARLVRKYGGK